MLTDTQLGAKVKAELRKRMRGLRNTMPESACAERSRAICENLRVLEVFQRAQSVALFWPITARHEVNVAQLHEELIARGVRVAYPAIDPETGIMTFRFVQATSDLVEQGYGFAEPDPSAEEAKALDFIAVPALAASTDGHRIGYGAGYYDRTLPRFRPATFAAVLYDFQLLIEVPHDERDYPVDMLVTDRKVLPVERTQE